MKEKEKINMKNFMNTVRSKSLTAQCRIMNFIHDRKGDLATNTIGAIIVAVVIVGLLVVAVNSFFPSFFSSMFKSMKTKLSANW